MLAAAVVPLLVRFFRLGVLVAGKELVVRNLFVTKRIPRFQDVARVSSWPAEEAWHNFDYVLGCIGARIELREGGSFPARGLLFRAVRPIASLNAIVRRVPSSGVPVQVLIPIEISQPPIVVRPTASMWVRWVVLHCWIAGIGVWLLSMIDAKTLEGSIWAAFWGGAWVAGFIALAREFAHVRLTATEDHVEISGVFDARRIEWESVVRVVPPPVKPSWFLRLPWIGHLDTNSARLELRSGVSIPARCSGGTGSASSTSAPRSTGCDIGACRSEGCLRSNVCSISLRLVQDRPGSVAEHQE